MTSVPTPVARSEYAPCPKCSAESATYQSYTWWGGLLGPKLFTHVKCGSCSTTYNGKTGRSNNTAIAVYLVVTSAVVMSALAITLMRVLR
jgi:hypothetical protein